MESIIQGYLFLEKSHFISFAVTSIKNIAKEIFIGQMEKSVKKLFLLSL
jgi:hypothetical protein